MNRHASALAAAVSATLGTMGAAQAATYTAVLTAQSTYSNNATGGSALNLTSSTATWSYDDVTNLVTQTGGLHNARSTTSPTSTLFRHSVTGMVIGNGGAATATSFVCTEGNFGGNVGASICGNYTLGANFANESTTTWGPGTDFGRTLGGDDAAAGAQQSILAFSGMNTLSFDGTTLVLTNRNCANACTTTTGFNSGYIMTFTVTPLGANDDSASTRLNTPTAPIDALANDAGFVDPVTVSITELPSVDASVEIQDNGAACADPCTANQANIRLVLTPSKPANNTVADYQETFTYSIDDGTNSSEAVVTVDVANKLVTAGDGAIDSIDTEGVNPVGLQGTFTVPLADLGDNGTVSIFAQGNDGTASVAGNVITYTVDDPLFFSGSDNFVYTVTDEDGETDTGAVAVNIANVSPSLADGSAETDMNTPVDIELTFEPGNGALSDHTFDVDVQADSGICSVDGTTLTYTPGEDFVGEDSCEVDIVDGDEDSDNATFNFTVNDAEPPPPPEEDSGLREDDGGSSADWAILSLLGGALLRRRRKPRA